VVARGAFVVNQVLDVLFALDLLAAVVAARVRGHHSLPVEDPHRGGAGADGQGLLHVPVRHRVVIEIKAHVRGLADLDCYHLFGDKWRLGHLQEVRVFLPEGLGNRERLIARAAPLTGGVFAPSLRLLV